MKFIIEYTDVIKHSELNYVPEECSFYMEELLNRADLELIINKISLAVSENRIINVSGFCGLDRSMISGYKTPNFKKGILKIEHNLKHGFAYNVHDDLNYEHPVNVNILSGWVCIGDAEKEGNSVEFISNCIMVIDDNQKFISLWLKPVSLPNL